MKILLFANTDWYLYNFRLSLAKALRSQNLEVVLVSPDGPFSKKLKMEGFKWICIPMKRRSANPISELSSLFKLCKIYQKEKPDVVQHFTLKCLVYGTIAAKISHVPSIVNSITGLGYIYSHKSLKANALRLLLSPILKFLLSLNNLLVILQNPDDEYMLVKNKIVNIEKTRLIKGSGVNVEKFCSIRDDRNQIPRVLLATRLIWDKGINDFIKAARILKQKGVAAEFLLAGKADDGNPASVSINDLEGWMTEGTIKYIGHIDDMPALLKKVDIVILPTSYGEGVPRILIEAAASSLPIIATDVPGCREIVIHNTNGILVPPKNPQALADSINYLVNSPEQRLRMGINGRNLVINEFDEKIVIKKTITVCHELLAVI